MFGNLFGGKKDTSKLPKAPEAMGLFLGGAFEIDELRLRLVEPDLIIEGAAKTQIIQAVGEISLSSSEKILRFYTDDDGFLQVLLSGGTSDNCIADVKLWYFYDTQQVGNDWDEILAHKISQPSIALEGFTFTRVWEGAGHSSPPIAMTETTYHLDGTVTETDQFIMLYERQAGENLCEYVTYAGEERVAFKESERSFDVAERSFVISTGFDLNRADLRVMG